MDTYEKKYKEALERAKRFIEENPLVQNLNTWIKVTFPELAESEDEKIRKEIKQLIQCMHDADPRKERWITWLEKQGEQKPFDYEHANIQQKDFAPKVEWKPSDAQMASITCAVRKMKESACYDSELVSLLNDLKKLKGG